MPGVAGGLLGEMHEHPAKRKLLPIATRSYRELVWTGRFGYDLPAAVTRLSIPQAQLL